MPVFNSPSSLHSNFNFNARSVAHQKRCLVGLTVLLGGMTLGLTCREVAAQRPTIFSTLRLANPLACLPVPQDDPFNPPLTVHLNGIPFAQVLSIMCRSSPGLSCPLPADLASKIDPNQTINLNIDHGTFQQALNDALDQMDPPMTFHMENGMYVLEASATPRPNHHKPLPPPRAPDPSLITVSEKERPFEESLTSLFQVAVSHHLVNSQKASFRISPAVTAFLDPITYEAKDATLDDALKLLLKAVPGQKTPLTFHKEKGVYVIGLDTAPVKPEGVVRAIGLPSYDPEPTIKAVSVAEAHTDVPLRMLFKQTDTNYVLLLPVGVTATPRITFAMQHVPLEQAVVHLLRSAPSEPMLSFQIYNAPGVVQPDAPLGPETRYYLVKPFQMLAAQSNVRPDMNDYRLSFHFQNATTYDALKTILADTGTSYTLDPALRRMKVNVSGDNLALEAAITKLLAASPRPLRHKTENGILSVQTL